MITLEQLDNVRGLFLQQEILNCTIGRDVAFGIKDIGIDNEEGWMVVRYPEGGAPEAELRVGEPLTMPDDDLGVFIAVLANAETWLTVGVGGLAAAIEAADQRKIVVTGKLPYFIRNVRSFMDMATRFGELLRSTSA